MSPWPAPDPADWKIREGNRIEERRLVRRWWVKGPGWAFKDVADAIAAEYWERTRT